MIHSPPARPKRMRFGSLKLAGCLIAFVAVCAVVAGLTPQAGAQADKPATGAKEPEKPKKPKKSGPPDPDAPTPEAQVVGRSFCGAPACHGAMMQDFDRVPHSNFVSTAKLGDAAGCEVCHGPASDHVGDQEHRKIYRLTIQSRENARRINDACVKCHEDTVKRPHYESLAHTREGVSCASCHEVHYDLGTPALLRLPGQDGPAGRPLDERRLRRLIAEASPGKLPSSPAAGTSEEQKDGKPAEPRDAAQAPPTVNRPKFQALAKTRIPIPAWRSSFTRERDVVTREQAVNELCGSCHRREASEARHLSHHPLLEGRVTCTNCHDPHRSEEGHLGSGRMLAKSGVAETCYQCHEQVRGPFRFEHEPVSSGGIGESCMECHRPHGSPNRSLLVMPTRAVCVQCHVDVQRDPAHQARGGSCWRANCHTAVHGSNHSAKLFFK